MAHEAGSIDCRSMSPTSGWSDSVITPIALTSAQSAALGAVRERVQMPDALFRSCVETAGHSKTLTVGVSVASNAAGYAARRGDSSGNQLKPAVPFGRAAIQDRGAHALRERLAIRARRSLKITLRPPPRVDFRYYRS